MPLGLDPHSIMGTLYAFYTEHQHCGKLNGGVDAERVWMSCTCGAVIGQTLKPATA